MFSFHTFLKQKTVKRTLLHKDNIFSPQIKKHPALRRHKNFRNSGETENYIGHFCQFSQKETSFYTSKQHFFLDFNLQFWRNATLLTRTRYLLFQVALCNQLTIVFATLKAISTFKPYCTPLWTIGFSTVTYIKLWWSVKDLQKNALKI